ncbi:MAG: SH3 domain-containing protein [Cellulosilyticaceae bacterium]
MRKNKWLSDVVILTMIPGGLVFAGQENMVSKRPVIISAAPMQVAKDTQKQVFYEDLDGDGKKEKIVLLATYDMDQGVYHLALKINDRQMTLEEPWMGSDVNAYVVDMSQKDKVKEIAIGGDWCSSDYGTSFYRYQAGKVSCIGSTEGTIKPVQLDKTYQMLIPGDGTVHTYTRGNALQTWYRDELYQLDDKGKLEMQPKVYYMMGTEVTLLMDLQIYEVPKLQGQPATVLRAGQKAKLLLTDDKTWCQIQDEAGHIGWIHLVENMGVETTSGVKWSYEVFEGLMFAD